MNRPPLVILLAGARETSAAADWLAQTDARGMAVWAKGADRQSLALPVCDAVPHDTDAVLDATHAFDRHTRTQALRRAPGAIYARAGRDPWVPQAGDNWVQVDTLEAAIAALPAGARVFAATGRNSLDALSCHTGHVFLRQLGQGTNRTEHANCTYVHGTGPFVPEDEVALLRRLSIDVVLARNIGGPGSFPKIAAARQLGLPVVMLRAPHLPKGAQLRSLRDVKTWVASL